MGHSSSMVAMVFIHCIVVVRCCPLSYGRPLFFLNDIIQDDKGVASSANIKRGKAIKSPNAKHNQRYLQFIVQRLYLIGDQYLISDIIILNMWE